MPMYHKAGTVGSSGKVGTVPFSVSGVWVFHCSLHILFWLKLLSNLKLSPVE